MLFKSTLVQFEKQVQKAVKELFDTAYKNQSHPQDLLLVLENGFYWEENVEYFRDKKLSPYVVGPGMEGHAAHTQFRFYDTYRRNIVQNRDEFIKKIAAGDNDYALLQESSIQIELMIYLKFWEAESILKTLYQLVRLCTGQEYDWYWNIEQFRDGRQQIVRQHIRNPMKNVCDTFYELILKTYDSQIRNAIAHSQFAFLGQNINLTNKRLSKYYTLHNLTFKEWEDTIHQIILFHDEIIKQSNRYHRIYIKESLPKHYGLPLRVTLTDGDTKTPFYLYDKKDKRWIWYSNSIK